MAREDNIRVFEDTEAWCRTNRKIAESLKASQAAQELILETDALPDLDKNRYEKPAKVVVSKKRTLEAAPGVCRPEGSGPQFRVRHQSGRRCHHGSGRPGGMHLPLLHPVFLPENPGDAESFLYPAPPGAESDS